MAGILAGLLGSFPSASGAYDLITSVTIGGTGVYAITLNDSGAWGAYKHLQIRAIARTTNTTNSMERLRIRFNGSSNNSYSTHTLRGNGSSVTTTANSTSVQLYAGYIPRGSISAAFAPSIIDILDFASTAKNTTVRSISGYHGSGQYEVALQSGLYYVTNSITSIELSDNGGYALSVGTRFALYGIKG